MGEIDTKPIDSVQSAINFFGQTNEARKSSPTNEKEEERERELASVKVQVEVKEAAHKQALLVADHYRKTTDELSSLLKKSDLKKIFYINESQQAASRVSELESALEQAEDQLQSARGEAALLREAKVESMSRVQAMERLLSEEKLRSKELSRQVSEANEATTRLNMENSKLEASYAEKLQSFNEMVERYGCIECEVNEVKEDVQVHEKKRVEHEAYIGVLEAMIEQIREEAKGEAWRLNGDVESVKMELKKAKEQENEAQVEMALLKFQIHKGRSTLAAAEAALARAQSEKTALYNALQQMGLEAEEIKKENKMLKEKYQLQNQHQQQQEEEVMEDKRAEEFTSKKVEEEEEQRIHWKELEDTKRELEVAVAKIGEMRTRAEQAISRAEAAEKAKAALEMEKKKRREQRERRKAAFAALRQESISREFKISKQDDERDEDDGSAKRYQPLAKVLNMKF